ncbi:MAG: thiamine pyrophosphate-dependent enzyme [Saprospiraceae bacterium]|nr:thiamine pyrophosphate-dependent enzyme [Saprospiraceae bacterium]
MPEFDSIEQLAVTGDMTTRDDYREAVLQDFWICCVSREVSLLGRREVLTGKAKFGILGDGKEVPQVALARFFAKGDWRSGYYRDQTWMFALGVATVADYFAQLYADAENDPWSGGRQMNAHFATPMIKPNGEFVNQVKRYNVASGISPTGGQMARAVGLAQASRYYRTIGKSKYAKRFSNDGQEVCFCSIGDASTSEGVFWEAINASAVMQIPLAVSVWDDGYGISVPTELQTVKGSISKALEGFLVDEEGRGIYLYTGKAWDYPGLCAMYERGIRKVRETHIPAVFHILECTQPQGHSTSGSHERYKSKERLQWEEEVDCINAMADWMTASGIATETEIEDIRQRAKAYAREQKTIAWKRVSGPVEALRNELQAIYARLPESVRTVVEVAAQIESLNSAIEPSMRHLLANARRVWHLVRHLPGVDDADLRQWIGQRRATGKQRYHTYLLSDDDQSPLKVPVVPPVYRDDAPLVNGYQVLNTFFDKVLERDERVVAFGEDVGYIGDVNQGFAGLQEKHGEHRVFDTGIREWTIMGQAIGLAMRGLRPIAEIQYLDYLVYGLTPLTDDLATIRYRSNGIQQAPAIIRTRGHRLEGIWHTGSPMGMVVHALRGMHVCVPRNMVQAAGMYNTLLQGNDPALVIECLNGYRRKERLPDNIGTYTVPLGVPEILVEGSDCTVVSYGSVLHEAQMAVTSLERMDIFVELIDVQTLLPFDLEGVVARSLHKTNRVLFVDEDVPGGASAYMMREVLETHGGYRYLDSAPATLTATASRAAYGTDGDYFCKPSAEDIVDAVYQLMSEADPASYPPA